MIQRCPISADTTARYCGPGIAKYAGNTNLDQHFGNYDRKILNWTNRTYCNDRYCDISVIVKYYYHKDASSQVFL